MKRRFFLSLSTSAQANDTATLLDSAREKIRRAVWTCRCLYVQGPNNLHRKIIVPMRGELLQPLSRRDLWILRRAAALDKHLPESARRRRHRHLYLPSRRHVLDWLRVDKEYEDEDGEEECDWHWCHTEDALVGHWSDASEESSDEDDSLV